LLYTLLGTFKIMKCFSCNQTIKNELEMKLLNSDGDFACDEKCKKKYKDDKDSFFENIDNDQWYEKNFFKLGE
jgi:hypothetical protein